MKKKSLILICLVFISTMLLSQPCNCFQWVDSTYQVVPMTLGTDTGGPPSYNCNNCSSQAIKLPFSFCFYGKSYDTVYINNKGNISFKKPVFNFSSTGFPAGNDTLMLAACWSDVDNRGVPGALVYYKITPTHLIVQWYNAGYETFDPDLYNDYQITLTNGTDSILPPGNNVSYCYYLMRWESADSSGGSGGFGGVPGVFGVNKGDHLHYAQFGTFQYRGYNYFGPFDTNSQLYWLDYKSFAFNTCVNGNNIPPVIVNPDSCYNDTICAGDTLHFSASFICPQIGQKATLTASSPGLSGLTSDTSKVHSLYRISNTLIGALKDTGMHIINLTATDNGAPPLTNTLPVKVFIKNCDTTHELGVDKMKINGPEFSIYPNPNKGKFTVMNYSGVPDGELSRCSIEIYNFMGEKVYSTGIAGAEFSIDLSSQPWGIYLYRVISENGSLSANGKFIIQ